METFFQKKFSYDKTALIFAAMNEKTVHILENVCALYIRHGIKNITMDFVAEHLGMSKKTLYRYFSDKEKLVEEVLRYFMGRQTSEFAAITGKNLNAIDKLYAAGKVISNILAGVPVSVINDLQKFYPDVLHKFIIYKREHILEQVKKNLQEGIRQGLYRSGLNVDIASRSYLALSESMMDCNYFPVEKYQSSDVFNELFMYHIRSIASMKGFEYIELHLKKFSQISNKKSK